MVSNFTFPHIDISATKEQQEYVGQGIPVSSARTFIREEHGRRIQNELDAAFILADIEQPVDERLPTSDGIYLEVDIKKGVKVESLERKKNGAEIKPAAVKTNDENERTIALLVPNHSRTVLEKILDDYTNGELTESGKPQKKDFVEAIERLRNARLETFWTDNINNLPTAPHDSIWWEVWCWPTDEEKLDETASILGVRAAEREHRLYFSEATVVPIYASRTTMELILFSTCSIIELRKATTNTLFFTEDVYENQEQNDWVNDFANRVIWPNSNAPTVCLLDTGVNRAHSLIEPALSVNNCYAVKNEWGVDDHFDGHGHGTMMAGIALHGDLTTPLSSQQQYPLKHRLESVKILPPDGFEANNPRSYGSITQSAISTPEITSDHNNRVYCLAVSNQNVSGSQATTWSAAIDQASCGKMPGDETNAPRRLVVVCAGNIPPEVDRTRILNAEDYPIEDPAQAWNAISVGGYTDKAVISEDGLADWQPFANVGDISPFSRTSVAWKHNSSPIKPEIVMEAGNRAVSPQETEVISVDSLALLSTGKNHTRMPLVSFSATSAATAQAARMAARLSAEHPNLWPETIRALMIHSAEWTEPMKNAFSSSAGITNNYAIVRKYGYGVPSFDRANASARNHLALIAQNSIQPYKVSGGRKFHECHYYSLPWPKETLEQIGNTEIKLKITLSYFIEPSPGLSASIDPQRYQSFGLRFDLRRKNETIIGFKKRVNLFERENNTDRSHTEDDGKWVLGPKAVSSGSLHCDVLTGPAIDLLSRDTLCIYPVSGWWRNRADKNTCEQVTRYALVVTIQTPDTEIDLYTPIQTNIANTIDIEVGL